MLYTVSARVYEKGFHCDLEVRNILFLGELTLPSSLSGNRKNLHLIDP